MSGAERRNRISEEDNLLGELTSQCKHEFAGGTVYAMAAAQNRRNDIAGNVFGGLDQVISLTQIQVELPLAEIYEGIRFDADAIAD